VGREYRQGPAADSESAVRSMVASGMGAGLLRLDQAQQGERNGEFAIWPGWRAHTWLCWIESAAGMRPPAVEVVRAAVFEAWYANPEMAEHEIASSPPGRRCKSSR